MLLTDTIIANQEFTAIGNLLKIKREAKGLTLEECAHIIKIRACYLHAIEEGRFFDILMPVYLKGYLKNYASFLEEDTQEIIALFEKAEALPEENSIPVKLYPVLKNNSLHPSLPYLLFSLCMVIIVYGIYRFYASPSLISMNDIYQNLEHKEETQDALFLEDGYKETRAFLSYLKSQKSRLVLLSKKRNRISIYHYNNHHHILFEKNIEEGDIYFIPEDEDIVINATHAESVEVFTEGVDYVFLGTMKTLAEDTDHPLRRMFISR